jgi:hypothetical protein
MPDVHSSGETADQGPATVYESMDGLDADNENEITSEDEALMNKSL